MQKIPACRALGHDLTFTKAEKEDKTSLRKDIEHKLMNNPVAARSLSENSGVEIFVAY